MGLLEPKRTGIGTSLAVPFSGTGAVMLLALTSFLLLVRFTEWLLTNNMVGLSTAAVVIFDLLGAAYVARYLVEASLSAAEGYAAAPAPPDPREAEKLFGALLGFVLILLFGGLTFGIAHLFGIGGMPVDPLLLAVVAVYFPMGLLALAVRDDLGACFPGTVLSGLTAAAVRYIPAALLCTGAGLIIYVTRSHAGGLLPLPVETGLDAAAAWLLMATAHRVGALHHDEIALQSLVPFPEPERFDTSGAIPTRPKTEIERLLERRRRQERHTGQPTD